MAINVIEQDEVALNSKKYKIRPPVYERSYSRFPNPIRIGDSEYTYEQILSNWVINDQRGGIGVEEMDESVDFDRCWWSNLILNYKGHMFLPRLATSMTVPSNPTFTLSNGDMETWSQAGYPDDWTLGSGQCVEDTNHKHGGTSSAKGDSSATLIQAISDPTEWIGFRMTIAGWSYRGSGDTVAKLALYRNSVEVTSDTGTTTGAWENLTPAAYVVPLGTTSLEIKITLLSDIYGNRAWIDDVTLTYVAVGNPSHMVNFNGAHYAAFGQVLARENAAGTGYDARYTFEANITALISSLNSKLYIFIGDSDNYYHMTTAEACTQSDSANANWGFQWDGKLFKINTSGTMAYSTDPDGGGPTWTADANITDIPSEIERFFIGKDADGADVPYCATNTVLKVLDFSNTLWLDSALKLPNHPNGGKGACYWHDGHYLSYGLGLKKYVTGSTATISEVGLNRDGGLPVEYNGEITTLLGESASDELFALVDASQTSGNSKSGVYAYDGRGWHCWWADTSNNGAMNAAIISNDYAYRLYWDCGGTVYYITLHRGIFNPKQLAGTQAYASSGIWLSPWFNAGTAVYDKTANELMDFAKSIDTDETVALKYRTDHANTDLDTGWTTLDTLNTTGEAGVNTEVFGSSAGVKFNTIQFRMDFARGSTNTNSPDVQALVLSFLKNLDRKRMWTFTVICEEYSGNKPKQIQANLKTAFDSDTFLPFIFRRDDTNETHYVHVFDYTAPLQTGDTWEGEFTVTLMEI